MRFTLKIYTHVDHGVTFNELRTLDGRSVYSFKNETFHAFRHRMQKHLGKLYGPGAELEILKINAASFKDITTERLIEYRNTSYDAEHRIIVGVLAKRGIRLGGRKRPYSRPFARLLPTVEEKVAYNASTQPRREEAEKRLEKDKKKIGSLVSFTPKFGDATLYGVITSMRFGDKLFTTHCFIKAIDGKRYQKALTNLKFI